MPLATHPNAFPFNGYCKPGSVGNLSPVKCFSRSSAASCLSVASLLTAEIQLILHTAVCRCPVEAALQKALRHCSRCSCSRGLHNLPQPSCL
ncbi:hypothetical protein SRHO_G00000470 [Serrasalmus rhombeus]